MRHYIALIHKEEGSDYGVSFPDLPGAITAGSTLDEARQMAAEALALHLEGIAEDGEALPEPSSLEEIMAIAENKGAVAVLVEAPAAEVKTVRVNVTMACLFSSLPARGRLRRSPRRGGPPIASQHADSRQFVRSSSHARMPPLILPDQAIVLRDLLRVLKRIMARSCCVRTIT